MAQLQAATPKFYRIACAADDTEYSQALPAGTKFWQLRTRETTDLRVAFETGDVATGDDYFTVPAGDSFSSPPLWGGAPGTIYVAHTYGSAISVELLCWY